MKVITLPIHPIVSASPAHPEPSQIKYSLAMGEQLENVFHRFYPDDDDPANPSGINGGGLAASELEDLARQFAAAVPHSKYSIAQLQGYLLGWKNDPRGAVRGIPIWIAQQEGERIQSTEPGEQQAASSAHEEADNSDGAAPRLCST
jgi:chaperone BCS1